jgi:hypothetical protein
MVFFIFCKTALHGVIIRIRLVSEKLRYEDASDTQRSRTTLQYQKQGAWAALYERDARGLFHNSDQGRLPNNGECRTCPIIGGAKQIWHAGFLRHFLDEFQLFDSLVRSCFRPGTAACNRQIFG